MQTWKTDVKTNVMMMIMMMMMMMMMMMNSIGINSETWK